MDTIVVAVPNVDSDGLKNKSKTFRVSLNHDMSDLHRVVRTLGSTLG